jgi:arylsulfatase A-like enzyme
MKAIMVMFDSLNRHMLPPYGCEWTHAPNFARLARRSVTFDRSYVCSMPCMPARRELHTGRPNFLHRGWGPLEPFDDSVPEMLRRAGVYTHLASDHYHYWEDGGATYHNRYNTWEFFRGHEGDQWRGQVADPELPPALGRHARLDQYSRQDWINREAMGREADQPQPRTFAAGLDFIRRNHAQDRWFLQLETFDPHEPFYSDRRYKDLYPHEYVGPHFDWPTYQHVAETPEQVEHLRYQYAALLSQCDAYLGDVLDLMDEKDMWHDTMLVVWTDHGFLLSEHDCWAKCWMPFYQEIAHTPFFAWDPRAGCAGERRGGLVQPSLDLGPTLLDFFGLGRTPDMLGVPLSVVLADPGAGRQAVLFGMHGAHVNVTDGRYVYMRAPVRQDNAPLYDYTHMPTQMRGFFGIDRMCQAQMAPPFTFTKGSPVMRIPGGGWWSGDRCGEHLLWDVESDPQQERPIRDAGVADRMLGLLDRLMRECDAPAEQWERLGL